MDCYHSNSDDETQKGVINVDVQSLGYQYALEIVGFTGEQAQRVTSTFSDDRDLLYCLCEIAGKNVLTPATYQKVVGLCPRIIDEDWAFDTLETKSFILQLCHKIEGGYN